MSLRAIWIVSLCQDFGKVYYFRVFQTVERRAQKIHKDLFTKIPNCDEFSKSLLIKLGLNSSKEFIEWRDSASSQMQLPVLSLKINDGELWPVLVIEQFGYLFCCLPLVEEKYENDHKISLFQIQSVSVGFSVLLGIISFVGPIISNEISNKFIELDNYLSLSMPFGLTSDTEPSTVKSILHLPENDLGTSKTTLKQPAWKPMNYKGKPSVFIHLTEFVRCIQCDKPGVQTLLNIYGNITMKVEMEGTQVDMSLTLSNQSSENLCVDSLVLHPCAQLSTSLMIGREKAGNSPSIKKFRISPPLHKFILCYYTTSNNKEVPILGVFKLKGGKTVDILLQLKLNESLKTIKNQFDFCEARIPFLNRESIKNADFNANCGQVQISEDRHTIIWSIGKSVLLFT
ncbi:AP-5 complex subunit mu-1-like [Centruroides sculpturatus]|uniref:AP-5 complex subunit mu-1-like n=1 Tax=Centruroides sculpturatus TaxID=218467 RepID=UPI000C6E6E37|nr:AP-5 complex subunit mu-1-like [Centruroides sculpturatus]